jgi:uncharacterized membrane protein YbhN (UPF0104 family)
MHAIGHAIARARVGYLVLAFSLMLASLSVGAVRWHTFLGSLVLAPRFRTTLRLYFVGTFFNAFLPTGVGGDVYKALRFRSGPGSLARAFASVLLDRLAGLAALALIAIVGCAVRISTGDHGRTVSVALVLSAAVLLCLVLLFALGRRSAKLGAPAGPEGTTRADPRQVLALVTSTVRRPRVARAGIALSVVVQGTIVAIHVLIAQALRVHVSVAALAAVIAIATITAALPISVNGLGLREAAYVWSLAVYGLGHDRALAFAFIVLGLLLASSAVGGVVYVVAGGRVAPPRLEDPAMTSS